MAAVGPLSRTPYFFLGRRPYREAELAAYLRREHRRGRRITEILNDPYIDRCGGQAVVRAALRQPDLIRALREDITDAIADSRPERSR
jgi:hypothetical protein